MIPLELLRKRPGHQMMDGTGVSEIVSTDRAPLTVDSQIAVALIVGTSIFPLLGGTRLFFSALQYGKVRN